MAKPTISRLGSFRFSLDTWAVLVALALAAAVKLGVVNRVPW
jgi:hypothetical protein